MASKLVWHQTELEQLVRSTMKENLKQAAIIIRDSARSKAPISDKPHIFRGKTYEPGSLKKSIGYRIFTEGGIYKDEMKARIGTSLIYGIFQELGPVTGEKEWKYKPFLQPAFHEKESEIKETLGVGKNILGRTKGLKPADILLNPVLFDE